MNKALKEAIWFYTGADYLIVNSLLWCNKSGLERGIDAVYLNNIDMIKDAVEMTPEVRFGMSKEEGEWLLDAYKRRTPKEINDLTKVEMIETAVNDIHIICDSMYPADTEITLFRNVDVKNVIYQPTVGQTVTLRGVTSTNTTGQEVEYGDGVRTEYVRYIINVSLGTPILELENDYREENEVILPPMQYKITAVRDEGNLRVIELETIKTVDVDTLISSAKAALGFK